MCIRKIHKCGGKNCKVQCQAQPPVPYPVPYPLAWNYWPLAGPCWVGPGGAEEVRRGFCKLSTLAPVALPQLGLQKHQRQMPTATLSPVTELAAGHVAIRLIPFGTDCAVSLSL